MLLITLDHAREQQCTPIRTESPYPTDWTNEVATWKTGRATIVGQRHREEMERRKKKTDERLIVWRNGRAYGGFRSYSDEGGIRKALAPRR